MKLSNKRGGILTVIIILLWLMLFFVIMVAFFSYKAGYLRFEIGLQEGEEKIVDSNTVARLEKKEELLNGREEKLKEREKQFQNIITQINIEKQKIEKEQKEVSADLQKISSYFEQFSEDKEKSYKDLARVYEAMKPTQVAVIFSELEIQTVGELLRRMKKRASAKILGEIGSQNANRAAEISRYIQGEDKKEAFMKAVQ